MAGVGAQNRDETLFSSVTLVQSDTVPLISWIVGPLGWGVGEGGEGGVMRIFEPPGELSLQTTLISFLPPISPLPLKHTYLIWQKGRPERTLPHPKPRSKREGGKEKLDIDIIQELSTL